MEEGTEATSREGERVDLLRTSSQPLEGAGVAALSSDGTRRSMHAPRLEGSSNASERIGSEGNALYGEGFRQLLGRIVQVDDKGKRTAEEEGPAGSMEGRLAEEGKSDMKFRFLKTELWILLKHFDSTRGVTPTFAECTALAEQFNRGRTESGMHGHVRSVSIKWWFENKRRSLRSKRKALKQGEEETRRRADTSLQATQAPRVIGIQDLRAWSSSFHETHQDPHDSIARGEILPSAPLRRALALEFSLAPPRADACGMDPAPTISCEECPFAREIARHWASTKESIDNMHSAHVTHSSGRLVASLYAFGKALNGHRDRMVDIFSCLDAAPYSRSEADWCVHMKGLPTLPTGLRFFARYVQEIHRWFLLVESRLISELSGRQRVALVELDSQAANTARSYHASIVAHLRDPGGDRIRAEKEFRRTLVAVEDLRCDVLKKLLYVDPNTLSLLTVEQSASLLLILCWPSRSVASACPMCSSSWNIECTI